MNTENYICPPPNCIQIEPVEGCTLACWFCALQSIRDNGADRDSQTNGRSSSPFKFMTLDTASRIANEVHRLGWNSRIFIAMHGEPTVHKDLVEIIAIFRRVLPKNSICLTTNGAGLVTKTEEKVEALFAAGLNLLVLDDYEHADYMEKIRPAMVLLSVPSYNYPEDKAIGCVSPYSSTMKKQIIFLEDVSKDPTITHQLTNQGGNSGSGKKKVDRRCAKPFRELSVRWDGNVALCCDDWPGKYKIGNVNAMPLDDLWNSDPFDAARRKLYQKQRDFGPCAGCDVVTPRDGLLPDKTGQDEMPLPDETTKQIIKSALSGPAYSHKPSEDLLS